uniref:Cytochrome c oxidase subunit 3 n=1 Tax=Baicaloclepsis grubei TaxID=1592345 RepID=A0A9E8GE24_9ANNE|nr:cytochrome c oxidase subunit III [Baicaloclepsis grubei]UZT67840.1 cytochrome c oxidase subunit III [Baicaloclepsis grubei]
MLIRQPFHLVEPSPWPLTSAISALFLTMGLAMWFHNKGNICLYLGMMLILISMYMWWRDITREATMTGNHTSYVVKGLRLGMLLFITSEICFFFGFFWSFFHSSLVPTNELGCIWPPMGITPLNTYSVPLLNTIILLSSGMTVTWTHHNMMESKQKSTMQALLITVILGLYFTFLQAGEYSSASFSIADSIYGTTFFVTTGFHGAHVIIGSIFLLVCLIRMMKNQFSSTHHFGFEAAAWYWHFVDVVWICLFISMYWWGS